MLRIDVFVFFLGDAELCLKFVVWSPTARFSTHSVKELKVLQFFEKFDAEL